MTADLAHELPAVVATGPDGRSFTHSFSVVTGPSGLSWLQCTCTEQCPTLEQAERHLEVVREWSAREDVASGNVWPLNEVVAS